MSQTQHTDFLDDLLSEDQISRGTADREQRATDWGTPEEEGVPPDAVVWPESTEDVASVVKAANEHDVPVTPYAAGTSLEGNAVPVQGGITLDMSRMDGVLDIRPEDLQVDVQPGIYGSDIDEAVAKYGLELPSLPSSGDISTIGGMLANDASGMKTVKYGEVSDWALELEVVLPTGEVVELGSKALKTSAGYNLKELIIGSEGTLGIITRVTLELRGRPDQIWGGRAVFETVDQAAAAIADAVVSGVDVAKIELIDELSVRISNEYLDTDLPVAPTVFLEFHANHGIEREVDFCQALFEDHGVESFTVSENDRTMTELWEARKELAEGLEPYRDDLTRLTPGDITVPMSKFADIVTFAKSLEEEPDLLIPCFGHAGDGNVHYTVLVKEDDPEALERGHEISKQIVNRAIEYGGTSTGEHGVGTSKQEFLASEHGAPAVDAMREIKRALDPNGILNPGKILPDD